LNATLAVNILNVNMKHFFTFKNAKENVAMWVFGY